MNANYETEHEFYSKPYSVDQLVDKFKFDMPTLMAYYIYGMRTLRAIQEIIDNNLYNTIERDADDVYKDKLYFAIRTTIVKNAISKMESCEILKVSNNLFVYHLN
jgi:hypothetical protein